MIEWLNNNQIIMGAISSILDVTASIIGVGVSVVAICISINFSKKQNRIALFDKKYEVYKDLKEYFDSSKGWPKAVSKFLVPSIKLLSDNVWAPEINEIVGRTDLLFSKGLSVKLHDIKSKYADIRRLDGDLGSYFSLLQELPDYQDIKPLFEEYLKNDSPSNDEENKFEELCIKYAIYTNETISEGKNRSLNSNFFDKYKQQSELYMEVSKMQKVILETMIGEIRPI